MIQQQLLLQTPVFEETLSDPQLMLVKSVDVSAFAGQTVYLTFRHFNCTNQYVLLVDNVSIANLQPDDAILENVDLPRYALIASNNTLNLEVKNAGSTVISSLDVEWNDGTAHTATISTNIAPGATATVSHPDAVSAATATETSLTVSITAVNGNVDSDPSNNDGNALMNTVSQIVEKAVLMEEGTGTWCGWCPRGEIAMNYMYDTYGRNEFVGVAVHNGDPMTLSAYDSNMNLSGYPGCNVDRAILGASVSQGLWEQYYNERKDLIAPAAIHVLSSTVTGNQAAIVVAANFVTPFASANYRIGVIVVEDGVTGTTSQYNQRNYYSGGGSGAMGGFENLADPVPAADMVYNHVGRALLGGFGGQVNSVPGVITDGQSVQYTFNYTVPAASDMTKMKVVPVLIDVATGEVVNTSYSNMNGSLGLAEEAASIDMNMFPNPATDVVTVTFTAENS